MNWADAVIALVILLSLLIGVLRGFTRELLGTVAWVLAFWVAFACLDAASAWLVNHIETPMVRKAAAFAGLFLSTLLVVSVIAFFASRSMRESRLAGIDRSLGGGFGFLRGLVLVAGLLMVAGLTPAKDDAWWQRSFYVTHMGWTAEALRDLLPASWVSAIKPIDEPAPALPDHKPSASQKGKRSD